MTHSELTLSNSHLLIEQRNAEVVSRWIFSNLDIVWRR